jgi:hypothetical protein
MNKLWKTSKPKRGLTEMEFLRVRKRNGDLTVKNNVKQRGIGGTLLHTAAGITPYFSGKTRLSFAVLCERND